MHVAEPGLRWSILRWESELSLDVIVNHAAGPQKKVNAFGVNLFRFD